MSDPVYERILKDMLKVEESRVNESYGNVYIEDDIRKGVSEEEIVKKIRSRYSWISQTQARQIYVDIKNGKTPNWIVKEANEENNEEEESQKKNTLVMAKDISKKL